MSTKLILFIVILTTISFFLRLYRFTEPKHYYFDEVYHAVTAKAYADNRPEAYDPFSASPKEGTAYDWLHPPVAKLIQAGSIKILGDKPLGWRLPSVIFGTAIIPATFILASLAFGPTAGLFAAVVVAFENMTFVMSRITMNDIFITFFSLAAFIFAYLYTKHRKISYIVSAAVFAGMAWGSKWTGVYTVGAIFLYIVGYQLFRKKLNLGPIILILIPPLVYLASYGQFWLQGHSITQFIDLHKQIWWYQNRHDLVHSYATTALYCVTEGLGGPKSWCPWIFDIRPVYLSYEKYGEKAGYIYNLGNPLIFWFGIVAVSYLVGKFLEERKKEYFLILLGYFIFWLPWVFTPRILFLHHYLPSIPFLSVAVGLVLSKIFSTRFKLLAILIVLVFIAVFFYFYPISSGYPIDPQSIDKYMWLNSWR